MNCRTQKLKYSGLLDSPQITFYKIKIGKGAGRLINQRIPTIGETLSRFHRWAQNMMTKCCTFIRITANHLPNLFISYPMCSGVKKFNILYLELLFYRNVLTI